VEQIKEADGRKEPGLPGGLKFRSKDGEREGKVIRVGFHRPLYGLRQTLVWLEKK